MIFNPEFRAALRKAYEPKQRKPRRPDAITQDGALLLGNGVEQQQNRSQKSDLGDDVPAAGIDSHNRIDPDDLHAPPEQSEPWWSCLVFKPDEASVSAQDALEALRWIGYRLGITTSEIQTPSLPSTITVGALHDLIEERYGKPGWTALVQCWQEAAGIKQPERKSIRSDTERVNRIPEGINPTVVSDKSTSLAFDTEGRQCHLHPMTSIRGSHTPSARHRGRLLLSCSTCRGIRPSGGKMKASANARSVSNLSGLAAGPEVNSCRKTCSARPVHICDVEQVSEVTGILALCEARGA
jgi:hypothetical protein